MADERGDFLKLARVWLEEVGLERELEGGEQRGAGGANVDMGRFLNRLLGLSLGQQELLIEYFMSILDNTLRTARASGHSDECVFEQTGRRVKRVHNEVVFRCPLTHAETRHLTYEIDRGISWEEAQALLASVTEAGGGADDGVNGFYQMQTKSTKVTHLLLAIERASASASLDGNGKIQPAEQKKPGRMIRVIRPSTGEHANHCNYILQRYTKLDHHKNSAAIGELWNTIFDATAKHCMHGPNCKLGPKCEAGRRLRTVHLLTGSTLPVWATVERALQGQGATNSSSWSGGAKSSSFTVIRVAETEDASGVAPSVKKQKRLLVGGAAPPPPPPPPLPPSADSEAPPLPATGAAPSAAVLSAASTRAPPSETATAPTPATTLAEAPGAAEVVAAVKIEPAAASVDVADTRAEKKAKGTVEVEVEVEPTTKAVQEQEEEKVKVIGIALPNKHAAAVPRPCNHCAARGSENFLKKAVFPPTIVANNEF